MDESTADEITRAEVRRYDHQNGYNLLATTVEYGGTLEIPNGHGGRHYVKLTISETAELLEGANPDIVVTALWDHVRGRVQRGLKAGIRSLARVDSASEQLDRLFETAKQYELSDKIPEDVRAAIRELERRLEGV